MGASTSLRDYQLALSERLQHAEAGARVLSKLGVQIGAEAWLVDLTEAGEVLPVPPISPVPLSRPWFRGIANVRGNLYSVTDFAAFLGSEPTAASEQARLLLVSERFHCGAALLVTRSLGLRNAGTLKPQSKDAALPWVRAQYADDAGKSWKELDIPALIRHETFLEVSL